MLDCVWRHHLHLIPNMSFQVRRGSLGTRQILSGPQTKEEDSFISRGEGEVQFSLPWMFVI